MSEAPSGKVAVLAKIPTLPGKRDELVKAMDAFIDNANTEAGTILYILHIDPKDDSAVYFYELYTDQDALAAHGSSPRFKELGASLRDLAGGRPEITVLTPVIGKGL